MTMTSKFAILLGLFLLWPTMSWAAPVVVYPNSGSYVQPSYLQQSGQAYVVYPYSNTSAQTYVSQVQSGPVVNGYSGYNWNTVNQNQPWTSYPTTTYPSQSVVTTTGQCPAGTQFITSACTANYPNPHCTGYCQTMTTTTQYPTNTCSPILYPYTYGGSPTVPYVGPHANIGY